MSVLYVNDFCCTVTLYIQEYYYHCNTYSIFSGNFNGLHAGGPNCLLGGASPHLIGGDGPGQPPPLSKPSLKASSSK